MKRRTTAAFLGGIAGSALFVGLRLAIPAAAADQVAVGDDLLPAATPSVSGTPQCCPPAPTNPPLLPTKPPATGTPTPVPSASRAADKCYEYAGDPSTVVRPGVGNVVVTLYVCNNKLVRASATITQSNWAANAATFNYLNKVCVENYKADISRLNYSGATLTSNSYKTSFRAALKKAGI